MKAPKRYIQILLLGAAALLPQLADAQCAMCRAVLESGGGNSAAESINNGIVYLMAVPYFLLAGISYIIYRKLKS